MAAEVSSPPEKAMPTRSPEGSFCRICAISLQCSATVCAGISRLCSLSPKLLSPFRGGRRRFEWRGKMTTVEVWRSGWQVEHGGVEGELSEVWVGDKLLCWAVERTTKGWCRLPLGSYTVKMELSQKFI